jgi:hypothetical protein
MQNKVSRELRMAKALRQIHEMWEAGCIKDYANICADEVEEILSEVYDLEVLKDRLMLTLKRVESLCEADKLLFQVSLVINHCKNTEKNLPDSFDDQLCEGIETYFRNKLKVLEEDGDRDG